ncbi:MAG TPA: PHB depolymerase family esterase, partial [Aestuariivirga sp.]|nr:PHB depolymerase family esterase [Aestuariivirga sp.]
MTSVMLATYPEIFAGGAIIAGLPFGGATTIPEAFESMRGNGSHSESHLQGLVRAASSHKGPWPTISIWQGSADRTVDLSNAEAIVDQWRDVHGLRKTPANTEIADGYTRRFWCDAEEKVLIEEYIIAGMGHGTPLNTLEDGLGSSGPFMLDVGISSTRQIAQFWGIVKSGKTGKLTRAKTKTEAPNVSRASVEKFPPSPGASRTAAGVKTVIENALRKAGLMA